MTDDLISRADAMAYPLSWEHYDKEHGSREFISGVESYREYIEHLPSAQPKGYIEIPETGIDDLSDGFHTFRQLYYQRMMLFATIVKQNKDKAWKSLKHEDGELCFGGGWFVVGIDTPEGSYTYHYEDSFYSLFDCEELECAKHWDGHTEKDVTRLLSLPSAQPKQGEWVAKTENYHSHWVCSICGGWALLEYNEQMCLSNFCPNCGADMREREGE